MSFEGIITKIFKSAGFDIQIQRNVFQPNYDYVKGWNLNLPKIKFEKNTILLLQLQDFVTTNEGKIVELINIEQYYGEYARQVVILHWPRGLQSHYQGKLNLIEFNLHSYNILKNLTARKREWHHLINYDNRQYAWQCLNGRRCWHRQQVVDTLKNWPHGILSYNNEIPLNQSLYSTYKFDNEDNFIRLANIYGSCNVNIVTETQYDCVPGIITEKTLMSLLSGQIPIVIGYTGIVADCKNLGYDMFDDIVDISYDNLPNNLRARMALELNKDLIQGQVDIFPYKERLRTQGEFMLTEYPAVMEMRLQQHCEHLVKQLVF